MIPPLVSLYPRRYELDQYDCLRRLDPLLDRLHNQIKAGRTPQTMPTYWLFWQSMERRLAQILKYQLRSGGEATT